MRGALDALAPDRLQHGVRSIEDPELIARLADSDITLDVCPTSNLLLSVYPTIEDHPLPQLLDAGIRCSLNGDDPLLFGPVLLEEYQIARAGMAASTTPRSRPSHGRRSRARRPAQRQGVGAALDRRVARDGLNASDAAKSTEGPTEPVAHERIVGSAPPG